MTMYAIYSSQLEITRKNGKLPDVDGAIEIAESRFFEDDRATLIATYDTQEDALKMLSKKRCELCYASFYALGRGFDAYMFAAVNQDTMEFLRIADWERPSDEEEEEAV